MDYQDAPIRFAREKPCCSTVQKYWAPGYVRLACTGVVARALNVFARPLGGDIVVASCCVNVIRIGERKYDIVHAQFGLSVSMH
jgi:hypothetical protein